MQLTLAMQAKLAALKADIILDQKNAEHRQKTAKASAENADKAARAAQRAAEKAAAEKLRAEIRRKSFERTAEALHIPRS